MEGGWATVHDGILELRRRLEEGARSNVLTGVERLMLYTTIHNMMRSASAEVYEKYSDSIKEYIASVVLPALKKVQSNEELMLRELVRRWEIYKVMVLYMKWIFHHLDTTFIRLRSLPTLTEVGRLLFHDMLYDHEMRIQVKNSLLRLIRQERDGQIIDGALVKNVLAIFEEIRNPGAIMDFYTDDFEKDVFEAVGERYAEKAASWIVEDSSTDYLLKVEECLKCEDRVAQYLHSSSQQKLLEIVQTELLSRYQTRLLENEHSGCLALIREYRKEDLSRMCRLFCRIPNGLVPIVKAFKDFVIISEGTSVVKLAEDVVGKKDLDGVQEQVAYVGTVVELYDKYVKYFADAFQHCTFFYQALTDALIPKEVAGYISPQMLATLCDDLLKNGGSQNLGDDDIEGTFTNVVKFVTYFCDKNMFKKLYRKKLANRLLLEKTTDLNHELSILSQLKHHCGEQLTSKMEDMVADLRRAKDSQSRFMAYLTDNPNIHLGMDLAVTVLTSRFWPSCMYFDINLPWEMAKCVEVFRDFYSIETKHRQLKWIYSWGTCDIIGMFDLRPIKMLVTTSQAALLLLFNASEKLSYSEIKSILNLTNEEVVRLLYSLACAKYKILVKQPDTTTVVADDNFEFNPNFQSKKLEIKIPLPPVDEKKRNTESDLPPVDEKKRNTESDKIDRCFAIDALIVRIMKSKKLLPYDQLTCECMEQLGRMFKLDIEFIEERIEDLMRREYLERDKQNQNILRYLP